MHSAFAVFAAALVVACCGLSQTANAATGGFVYWSHGNTVTPQGIGRANLDGTGVDENFITGTNSARGVAVDGQHVYWANFHSIGRANLDGTGVDQDFIPNVDNNLGQAVAVDGQHVYWTAVGPQVGLIGRANLDGSGIDYDFIKVQSGIPQGVGVDSRHILWSSPAGVLGLASLDGQGVLENFLDAGLSPRGLFSTGRYVYWANSRGVGRADGFDNNETFIADPFARFVTVNSQNVFWTNARGIGRASLDGSDTEYGLIAGVTRPEGIAVSASPARTCAGREATIVGGAGDNKLSGTPGLDVIVGGGGDDRIKAGSGDDLICAGSGDDRLAGGGGRDRLRGGPGKDVLLGGGGRDRLSSGPGGDREVQ